MQGYVTITDNHCAHAEMGAVVYSSSMCLECYREYLENAGGQLQGHNPPAYTRGLIKAGKQSQVGPSF